MSALPSLPPVRLSLPTAWPAEDLEALLAAARAQGIALTLSPTDDVWLTLVVGPRVPARRADEIAIEEGPADGLLERVLGVIDRCLSPLGAEISLAELERELDAGLLTVAAHVLASPEDEGTSALVVGAADYLRARSDGAPDALLQALRDAATTLRGRLKLEIGRRLRALDDGAGHRDAEAMRAPAPPLAIRALADGRVFAVASTEALGDFVRACVADGRRAASAASEEVEVLPLAARIEHEGEIGWREEDLAHLPLDGRRRPLVAIVTEPGEREGELARLVHDLAGLADLEGFDLRFAVGHATPEAWLAIRWLGAGAPDRPLEIELPGGRELGELALDAHRRAEVRDETAERLAVLGSALVLIRSVLDERVVRLPRGLAQYSAAELDAYLREEAPLAVVRARPEPTLGRAARAVVGAAMVVRRKVDGELRAALPGAPATLRARVDAILEKSPSQVYLRKTTDGAWWATADDASVGAFLRVVAERIA